MKLFLNILVLLFCLNAEAAASDNFGLAASDGKAACVAFPNIKTAPPRFVSVVLPDTEIAFSAEVLPKLKNPCAALASAAFASEAALGKFYALKVIAPDALKKTLENGYYGIVVPTPPWKLSIQNSKVIGNLSPSRKPIKFRRCASSEGLWLSVWESEPLKGRRLWHAYVYLNYDVEPSCTPEDYETRK